MQLKKDREKGSKIVFKPQSALRTKVEGEKVFSLLFVYLCREAGPEICKSGLGLGARALGAR